MMLVSRLKQTFPSFFPLDNSGWKCPGGGTCYWYELETVTWDWARQSCREKNAMLVKIASNSKNRLIGDMIKTNIWIGLNDRVEAGKYTVRHGSNKEARLLIQLEILGR